MPHLRLVQGCEADSSLALRSITCLQWESDMYKCSVSFSYYHYVKRKKRGKKEKCRLKLFLKIYLFTCFWLLWVFVAALWLSLVMVSGGYCSLRCVGVSRRQLLLLQSMGSRLVGSIVVELGLSCSMARWIFWDQGSNLCPLHWQADS